MRTDETDHTRPWVVLKFGGTSVGSSHAWDTITRVVRSRVSEGFTPIVVVSAMSGISDALERLVVDASKGEFRSGVVAITQRHVELAERLGVLTDSLSTELRNLERNLDATLSAIERTGEATPNQNAEVLATGEMMSSRVSAAVLGGGGVEATWLDVRTVLQSRVDPTDSRGAQRSYLSAEAEALPRPDFFEQLEQSWLESGSTSGILRPEAFVTQGFIAANSEGETVLLGRGGSDATATYLAVATDAVRVEIWTDVPGMFTADPRAVPSARLLHRLAYDEAQEIATTGNGVLHPRCIPAIRSSGIPIHILSTLEPDREGTVIGPVESMGPPGLKAISYKTGVVLVSIDTLGMWQEVGFLARIFERFRAHGISVDLVSTSETNVTVSLDGPANTMDRRTLDGLVADLSQIATTRVIEPCASISLVGRGIRRLIPKVAPSLQIFDEEKVHLIAQAANDLNLTIVVNEDQAKRLVKKLHHSLIRSGDSVRMIGPTWGQIRSNETDDATPTEPWWIRRSEEILALMATHSAAFVYDLPTIRAAARSILGLTAVDRALYAMKANYHPAVLRTVLDAGLGLECVSAGELRHAFSVLGADLEPTRVLFTPNFAERREYELAFDLGVHVTVDALHPLEHWPDMLAGREILLRVDAGSGDGHDEKVRTVGPGAKFGISLHDLPKAVHLADSAGATVVGLHVHSGSGIVDSEHWGRNAEILKAVVGALPDVRYIDLGGGFGVADRPGAPTVRLREIDQSLERVRPELGDRELWVEPGRYVVADGGVLVARVTQVKEKNGRRFIGIATGMNSLLRPALYGAHHEVTNLTRLHESDRILATVVGPICETGDRLGVDRLLPSTNEGDLLLVAQAGAYGRVMASSYNLREPATEFVLN